jgi:hypothetical protein
MVDTTMKGTRARTEVNEAGETGGNNFIAPLPANSPMLQHPRRKRLEIPVGLDERDSFYGLDDDEAS